MESLQPEVPRKVEEALIFRLKHAAMKQCRSTAGAYADCCRGRSFSMAWACRGQLRDFSACLGQHTGDEYLNKLKLRWVQAGKPEQPDWDDLLLDLYD
eukprot:jgi/Astpho2/9223/e_gw1.00138.47.1_t